MREMIIMCISWRSHYSFTHVYVNGLGKNIRKKSSDIISHNVVRNLYAKNEPSDLKKDP